MPTLEDRLILTLCRTRLDAKAVRGAIRPGLDWDRLLQKVDHLELAALCHVSLSSLPAHPGIPSAVIEELARRDYHLGWENTRLYENACDLLTAMERNGIPVIVLKGAALAQLAYRNIAARSVKDLDILVQAEHLDAADRVLRDQGYKCDDWNRPADWYRNHHHHLAPYVSRERDSNVALHQDLFPPGMAQRLPIRGIWDRSQTVEIAGAPARVLAPPDFVFHLCLDLAVMQRFEGGLRTLCDLARTIDSWESTMDWRALLRSVHDLRASRPLYYALSHAEQMVGARVPGEIVIALKSMGGAGSLSDRALNALIPRLVLSDASSARVPDWMRADMCGELLRVRPRWKKALAVAGLFFLKKARGRHPEPAKRARELQPARAAKTGI